MDRESVDERLIRRGELLLSLESVDGYGGELRIMNRRKVRRPYVLTERYAEFLSVVRYLFGFPYRQLEGFTRALDRLGRQPFAGSARKNLGSVIDRRLELVERHRRFSQFSIVRDIFRLYRFSFS